jgi:hypothetical protein
MESYLLDVDGSGTCDKHLSQVDHHDLCMCVDCCGRVEGAPTDVPWRDDMMDMVETDEETEKIRSAIRWHRMGGTAK